MRKITVIHGPNLNMLGEREVALYGKKTLKEMNAELTSRTKQFKVECYQSNAEHDIIEKIQSGNKSKVNFFIINAGGFTHTSISIRDALLSVDIPFIEVHLTNPLARESFRHNSYLSDIAIGVVSGLGSVGYMAALDAAICYLEHQ